MSATTTVTAASVEPAKKKSKKKLIIIAVVVVALLGGGGYYYLGMSKAAAKPGTSASVKAKPKPTPKPGAVITIDPITVNLSGGHFLKLGLALQATATAKTPPDGAKALNLAIDEFSGRSVAELSSTAGRHKAQAELVVRVNKAYDGDVMDVYFTSFVMQ